MGSEGIISEFFISALDGGEWSTSLPGCFAPREITIATRFIEGWMLWSREKILDPAWNRKLTIQPISCRYADRGIPKGSLMYSREAASVSGLDGCCCVCGT
jgi:hypothetical protein